MKIGANNKCGHKKERKKTMKIRILSAFFIIALLVSVTAFARISPALEIIEKQMGENKPASAVSNMAPEAGDMSITTQRGIAVFESFLAADADGDDIGFEIVKYPSHGSVKVLSDDQFVYLPLSDYTGKDSFVYKAVDVYGSSSSEKTVDIKVSKPAADVYFKDMKNHWAHNSAIKMASTGLMTGEDTDGELYFKPDEDMTRGDFLALSLIMAGHEKNIPLATKTVFADDAVIPMNIKSYVQYAYDKGIVSGFDNGDGTVNFESGMPVTRAQAAVIIGKILDLSEENEALPSYKDASDIPVWANSAVSALAEIGIMSGDAVGSFSADKNLSRAEGAEIICNVASYVEDKQKEQNNKKERNLFNLFGLLG